MSVIADLPESLAELYCNYTGEMPHRCEEIPLSGGNRRYFRLYASDGQSFIGMQGTDIQENEAFVYLDKAFSAKGINVPKVYAINKDRSCYLQQDLGDTSLFSILHTEVGDLMTERAIRDLPTLQTCPDIDFNNVALQKPFSKRSIMWDLNYFKYDFLKPIDIVAYDEDVLEDDFMLLCSDIYSASKRCEGFMYRDCQSRNIMINGDKVWWIDFQGGRRGPMIYDAVSMLWQAKAGFSGDRREELLDIYFDSLTKRFPYPLEYRDYDVKLFAFFRTLQVLGAYGFRGLTQNRSHFLTSIPAALNNLESLLEANVATRYPHLQKILRALIKDNNFKSAKEVDKLTVEIFSFSYKKGYPKDMSGNGGGFMFDCRALHNPGRYDRYKPLTGMDNEVIEFLEERGEIQPFLQSCWQLTDAAVERYIQRGFSHLQIGFGCTGGRHRSVYSAEHTAQHIAHTFKGKVIVHLCHREQKLEKIL